MNPRDLFDEMSGWLDNTFNNLTRKDLHVFCAGLLIKQHFKK